VKWSRQIPVSDGVVGVVDIGTNTIKFSLARFEPPGAIQVILTRAETVRLGYEIDKTGLVDPVRIERALQTLNEFSRLANDYGAVELFGVATEALRSTSNGALVLSRIRQETGWDIEMISGDAEARLTFDGLRMVMQPTENALLVDIGGGSTEFVLAVDRTFQSAESLPVGSGRLADRFFSSDPPGLDAVLQTRGYALQAMRSLTVRPDAMAATLYLVGGNGMFLLSLCAHFGRGEQLDPASLSILCGDVASARSSEISAVLEIPVERARVLPAGVGIALAAINKFRPAKIVATESGINRGLLVNRFGLD